MKKYFKITALALTIALLSGCGMVGESEKATKKKAEENAIVTVNGTAVSTDRFNYYFYSEQDDILQNAGITNASDIPSDFWEQKTDGKTNLETAKEKALEKLVNDVLLYQKAVKEDIKLTSDEKSSISSQIGKMKQDQNTTYQLSQVGISIEEYEKLLTESYHIQKLTEKYIDSSKIKVDKDAVLDEMKKDYVKAKHVLILTQSQDGTALPDDEKAKKLETAKEVLAKAKAGEDFDKLVSEYGEDPGMKSNPDGYLFTKGQMVQEFEDAAFALGENQISGIVETSYGYHIIKRVPFDVNGTQESQFMKNGEYNQALPSMTEIAEKMKSSSKIETNKKNYDAVKATIINNQ